MSSLSEDASVSFDSQGTYIITGGLGFVGQQLLEGMISNGAKTVVLVSSSRDTLPDELLEKYQTVTLVVRKCDISEFGEVKTLFNELNNIKGVVHAAGSLDDGIVDNLDEANFEKVKLPKLVGAQNIISVLDSIKSEVDFI